jgi:DNA-binding transcriptional regulator/RsmH inhibitor MraZ
MRFSLVLVLFVLLVPVQLPAWGGPGHSIITQTAAFLVAEKPECEFMRKYAYSLAYYSNVPDVVWKANPKVYMTERWEHWVDIEIYERLMKKGDKFLPDRRKFFRKNKKIKRDAGYAYWRIHELSEKLQKHTERLKGKLSKKRRTKVQKEWMIVAGVVGHYVGDLAQPLHTTENYDGQMTGQKGVHAFFEHDMVEHNIPQLNTDVLAIAQKRWKEFSKKNASLTVFELAQKLAQDSFVKKNELFKLDKKTDRINKKHAALVYRPMITERMVLGALYLAEIWSRNLGWEAAEFKESLFEPKPSYIYPNKR